MKVFVIFFLLILFLSLNTAGLEEGGEKEKYIIAAHYMTSFRGSDTWLLQSGNKTFSPAYKPLLGYYDNRDQAILSKHIEWAKKFRINTFMLTWPGLSQGEYYHTYEDAILLFLQNPDFKKINFFFVYSFIMGLRKAGEGTNDPVDFNNNDNINKLLYDFTYASKTYFVRPNYLKIRGRPVVYLWATSLSKGNLKKAIKKLRNTIKSHTGKDPYLIADDHAWWTGVPNFDTTPLYDAIMSYAMIKIEGQPPISHDLSDVYPEIVQNYAFWSNACSDLGIDFIPCVYPGFNAVGAPWCYNEKNEPTNPVVTRNPTTFKNFINQAEKFIDPDINMFYITSWNEWYEGTNIEPSQEFNFSYLKVVKKAIKRISKHHLPKNMIKFEFKKVINPEGSNERLLATAFDYIEFLGSAQNPLLRIDMGTPEARGNLGIGWYDDETWSSDLETFVWAGMKKKYATLHFDLPPEAKYIKLRILYWEGQETSIFLDKKYMAGITSDTPWLWTTHLIDMQSSNLIW